MDTVEAAEWLDLQPVSKCTKRVRLSQGEGESNLGEMWRSLAGHLGNESMHDQPFCCIAQRSPLAISSLHCVYCVQRYSHDTVIEPLQVLSVMTDEQAKALVRKTRILHRWALPPPTPIPHGVPATISAHGIMSLPCPKLLPEGKTHLDALLQAKLAEGTAPSIFWAATNANETIYENQAGNVVMGDPASGRVNRDSGRSPVAGRRLL